MILTPQGAPVATEDHAGGEAVVLHLYRGGRQHVREISAVRCQDCRRLSIAMEMKQQGIEFLQPQPGVPFRCSECCAQRACEFN